MFRRLRKLADLIARFGSGSVARICVLWSLRKICGYRAAMVYCLELDRIEIPARCQKLDWEFRGVHEIAPELMHEGGYDLPGLERVLGPGGRCFIGSLDGVQCYLSLVSADGFAISERVRVGFANAPDAYVGNCVTLEKYRGQGVYPCGLLQLGSRLRAEGNRRLYLFVEEENLASIRSVAKVGFRAVAKCSGFKVGRLAKSRWRTLEKGIDTDWDVKVGAI